MANGETLQYGGGKATVILVDSTTEVGVSVDWISAKEFDYGSAHIKQDSGVMDATVRIVGSNEEEKPASTYLGENLLADVTQPKVIDILDMPNWIGAYVSEIGETSGAITVIIKMRKT